MKLLLLVQTDADAKALESAALAIKSSPVRDVWAVFSPAISVDQSAAAATFDKNIAELLEAEKRAAGIGDYTAAAGYKTSREEQVLDRAKALRDAWKTVPQAERTERVRGVFAPFIETLKTGYNLKISGHQDHFDPDQWIQMLTSLAAAWNPAYTPGSFMVGWPSSLALANIAPEPVKIPVVKMADPAPPAPTPAPAPKPAKVKPDISALPRGEQLQKMAYFAFKSAATKAGVNITGKSREAAVAEILAAEGAQLATA